VEYDYNGQTTLSSIVRGNCSASQRNEISLYPNPSQGISALNMNLEHATRITLTVVDSKGAVIQQKQLQLPAGNNSIPLNMSSYAKGIYSIRVHVSNTNETKTLKLIRK